MLSKPKTLALAVASATLASSVALADQTVSPTGQVLLYPLYTTENNANTYMHITNNTDDQKAVKVRFMEAQNSAVVLEFNVYLGPHDIFPVALASNDFGGTSVITNDSTCTVPQLGTSNPPYDGTQELLASGAVLRSQPFVPYLFESEESGDISRTLMGHLEVIEMGVVGDTVDVADCDSLIDLWTTGTGAWASNTATNVTGPTGGLSGSSLFIVPELAYSMSMPVTAIDGWAKSGTNYHKSPGNLAPDLDDGVSKAVVNGVTVNYTSKTNGSVLAMSALLASQSINNEVQTEDVLAAETDWVVTFPTKKYFTEDTASAPFTVAYDSTKADGGACEPMSLIRRDRESNVTSATSQFVPDAPNGIEDTVCSAVNVLSFNSKSALITDTNKDVSYSFQAGSATLNTSQKLPKDDNNVEIKGLPILGFAGTRIVNGPMSYGYAVEHKSMTVTSS